MMNKKSLFAPLCCLFIIFLSSIQASHAATKRPSLYGPKHNQAAQKVNRPKQVIKVNGRSPALQVRSQYGGNRPAIIKRPGGVTRHQNTQTKGAVTRKTVVKKTTPLTVIKHHHINRATKDIIYTQKSGSIQAAHKPNVHVKTTVRKSGKKYRVRGKTYQVLATSKGYHEKGTASWYGKPFHGRKTANGETYNMYNLSAAHKSLPLNSVVKVKNLNNNKEITIKINDRGPFKGSRVIDLSYAAAKKLGMVEQGLAKVEIKAIS